MAYHGNKIYSSGRQLIQGQRAYGRKPGQKNLKSVGYGSKVNSYGVRFTKSELKEVQKLRNQFNYRRRKQIKQEASIVLPSGMTQGRLRELTGQDSDFVLASRKFGLNRFENRSQFKKFKKSIKRVIKKTDNGKKMTQYKRNYASSITKAYGDNKLTRRIKNAIYKMSDEDFRLMSLKLGTRGEISYTYHKDYGTLEDIVDALDIKVDDDDIQGLPQPELWTPRED